LNAQTFFTYDASGNRTNRTIVFSSPSQAPSQAPPSEDNDDESISKNESNFASTGEGNFAFSKDEDNDPPMSSPEMPENNSIPEKIYTDKLKESDVLIYPNPTKGVLAVEIRNKNPQIQHQLTVLNLNGSIIFQKSHIGDYTQIDLSSQPKGVYLLRISSQDSFITWKIIKE
jgi:hypothetical protein